MKAKSKPKKLSDRQKAIDAINENGLLLVFPVKGKPQYNSIWKVLYPRSEMRWEWDENGDDRVSKLWRLREELSSSKEVVYSKWLLGRATFFSRDLFKALYKFSRNKKPESWTKESNALLDVLRMDSPLSTRQLKEATDLQGKYLERVYEKGMKPLWQHFDIVACGEIEDSSFPSLAIGATETIFEELVVESREMSVTEMNILINQAFEEGSPEAKAFQRTFAMMSGNIPNENEL